MDEIIICQRNCHHHKERMGKGLFSKIFYTYFQKGKKNNENMERTVSRNLYCSRNRVIPLVPQIYDDFEECNFDSLPVGPSGTFLHAQRVCFLSFLLHYDSFPAFWCPFSLLSCNGFVCYKCT